MSDPDFRDPNDPYRGPVCSYCEVNPTRDESESVFARYRLAGYERESDLCLECAAPIFDEELRDLSEGLKLFAPIFERVKEAA